MARPRLLLPLASFIARSAALVTPVAEAAVPPVPFHSYHRHFPRFLARSTGQAGCAQGADLVI
jgi:hypothetical protein